MIKLACGCMVLALNVSVGEYESMLKMKSHCFLEGLGKFGSAGFLLMNAVVFFASCDHKFTERQLDHRNVGACTVDLSHTEKRGQTPALNSLIKQACGSLGTRVQSGSATASAQCLCMPCSVGILPPTAGSCSTSVAHITAPAPPHTVHGSY